MKWASLARPPIVSFSWQMARLLKKLSPSSSLPTLNLRERKTSSRKSLPTNSAGNPHSNKEKNMRLKKGLMISAIAVVGILGLSACAADTGTAEPDVVVPEFEAGTTMAD